MEQAVPTKTSVLAGREPQAFWDQFEKLTTIARPSRHEEPVIDYVRQWGADHGFPPVQDAARNLVFDVPATPGREGAQTVVLQGHLDWSASASPTARTIRLRGGSSSSSTASGSPPTGRRSARTTASQSRR
jgi:hypothetical protein